MWSYDHMTCVLLLACEEALERHGVLADELVADEVVIEHGEAQQRQLGQVHAELEALVEQRVEAVVTHRLGALLRTVRRYAEQLDGDVRVDGVAARCGAAWLRQVLTADHLTPANTASPTRRDNVFSNRLS